MSRLLNFNVTPAAKPLFAYGIADNPPGGSPVAIYIKPDPANPARAQGDIHTDQNGGMVISFIAPGFQMGNVRATIPPEGHEEEGPSLNLEPSGPFPDPSVVPLETLAAICGSMWTARCNVPYGPRPGQDDNILAMDYYEFYGPEDRAKMIDGYLSRGYRHYVTGPIVDAGYHGLYPARPNIPTQAEWDAYLDTVEERWNLGLIPIHFAKPDNWSMDMMQALVPFYQQPRAQKLLRIIVWTGWEPWRYELSNEEWNLWLAWGNEIMPNALQLVHTVCDIDALTGKDDDHKVPGGNATCWHRSAPFLHGWLIQLCGYQNSGVMNPTPEVLANFHEYFVDMGLRFRQGKAGWPTFSKWGNSPLRIYAAEFAAYPDFWLNWPEVYARQLGDVAMAAAADGYLDGGTVPVPEHG